MPSPALAFPFRTAADQIEREARYLERAHIAGECRGQSVAQLRGQILEDLADVAAGCGPEELMGLARVVARFARSVR